MPIYIKTTGGDIIGFDAVTSYSKDFASRVTEHPLESGSNVTDHVIRENVRVKIRGVFSDYSPSYGSDFEKTVLNGEELSSKNISNKFSIQPLTVKASNGSIEPSVSGTNFNINPTSPLPQYSEIIRQKLKKIQRQAQTVTIFEVEAGIINTNSYFQNCIITSLSFSEDDNSGDALYVSIDLTVVTFSDVREVELSTELVKAAADEQAKVEAVERKELEQKDWTQLRKIGQSINDKFDIGGRIFEFFNG